MVLSSIEMYTNAFLLLILIKLNLQKHKRDQYVKIFTYFYMIHQLCFFCENIFFNDIYVYVCVVVCVSHLPPFCFEGGNIIENIKICSGSK